MNHSIATLMPIALILASCGTSRFRPADDTDPNRLVAVTGTIAELRSAPGETMVITVEPEEASRNLLADGQERMVCELPVSFQQHPVASLFAALKRGARVEVAGYFVVDAERPGIHLIRPITSIDLYPDR